MHYKRTNKKSLYNIEKFITGVVISCLMFLGILPVNAQIINEKNMQAGNEIVLKSEILNEDRTIYVHCPSGNQNTKYPVLYHLDGDYNFKMTTGIIDFLMKNEIIPEMIVVGIGNLDRTRDMTPVKDPTFRNSGGAEKFYKFINNEVIPYVEQSFPVSDTKILSGHSLGGLFTLYSFLTDYKRFEYYIAVSPSIQFKDFHYVPIVEDFFKERKPENSFLFMSFANEGNGGAFRLLTKMYQNIKPHLNDSFRFIHKHYPNDNHVTSIIPATSHALQEIFKDR